MISSTLVTKRIRIKLYIYILTPSSSPGKTARQFAEARGHQGVVQILTDAKDRNKRLVGSSLLTVFANYIIHLNIKFSVL